MGIGTGPVLLSVDGYSGIGTALGDVTAEIDLDASDISDLTASALGFGGYATDGDWMVQYKLGKLKLEGSGEKALQSGNTVSVQINFGSLFFLYSIPQFFQMDFHLMIFTQFGTLSWGLHPPSSV